MIQGVYTAIITPFRRTDRPAHPFLTTEVDVIALEKIINHQIENGIDGIVVAGTTGECPTLTPDEHSQLIRSAISIASGRVPIIAGTGANATHEAIALTLHAQDAGAAASLQVTPYYNKPTQEGLYEHFRAIAQHTALPLIIYNIKGRCVVNLETETLQRLVTDMPGRFIAVKEASGDLNQIRDVIGLSKQHGFTVLSGDDNLTYEVCKMGGHGVISVASHLIPRQMKQLVEYARNGQSEQAHTIHNQYAPLFRDLFIQTNPMPVKAAMAMNGFCEELYRSPMVPMKPVHRDTLCNTLRSLSLI